MSVPGIAPEKKKKSRRSVIAPTARAVCWSSALQDRGNSLAVLPSHLLNILNGRDQITGAARSHEQPVLLDEESGHTDSLRVRYPTYVSTHDEIDEAQQQRKKRSSASIILHSERAYASPVPGWGKRIASEFNLEVNEGGEEKQAINVQRPAFSVQRSHAHAQWPNVGNRYGGRVRPWRGFREMK